MRSDLTKPYADTALQTWHKVKTYYPHTRSYFWLLLICNIGIEVDQTSPFKNGIKKKTKVGDALFCSRFRLIKLPVWFKLLSGLNRWLNTGEWPYRTISITIYSKMWFFHLNRKIKSVVKLLEHRETSCLYTSVNQSVQSRTKLSIPLLQFKHNTVFELFGADFTTHY